MRENLVHVPAEGTASPAGQHHERGQPTARQAAQSALGQTGTEMVSIVRQTLMANDKWTAFYLCTLFCKPPKHLIVSCLMFIHSHTYSLQWQRMPGKALACPMRLVWTSVSCLTGSLVSKTCWHVGKIDLSIGYINVI